MIFLHMEIFAAPVGHWLLCVQLATTVETLFRSHYIYIYIFYTVLKEEGHTKQINCLVSVIAMYCFHCKLLIVFLYVIYMNFTL